jgi:arylsulfatase A-like enzyme
LTGLRPDTTGVYENNHVMRRKAPNVVTLPQHFREHGYHVAGGGKVFHDVPPHCDDPLSWDEYFWWNEHGPKGGQSGSTWRSPYSIPPDPQPDGRPMQKITPLTKRNFDWGAVDEPESNWPDSKVADWASKFLAREHDKPFFLSVGIFRPHVPWFNPARFVEKYPLDDLLLPPVKVDDLDDLGEWARRRAHDKASQHDQLVEFGEWKPAVQAYLASISFADANVGRVLYALEKSPHRDNTIVVFWSDHGYHLGEKGHWHKRTLWERATHVPFIVSTPNTTRAGTKCSRPVSLLDIYPTLISLCDLDSCTTIAQTPTNGTTSQQTKSSQRRNRSWHSISRNRLELRLAATNQPQRRRSPSLPTARQRDSSVLVRLGNWWTANLLGAGSRTVSTPVTDSAPATFRSTQHSASTN